MTPKERAAMQQALEALDTLVPLKGPNIYKEAITSLREALAEQAEPVSPYKALPEEIWSKPFSSGAISVPVQQAEPPVRTKDLTDDEIETTKHCLPRYLAEITDEDLNDFARAVIAADREINK